jgi:hypothetical protein
MEMDSMKYFKMELMAMKTRMIVMRQKRSNKISSGVGVGLFTVFLTPSFPLPYLLFSFSLYLSFIKSKNVPAIE